MTFWLDETKKKQQLSFVSQIEAEILLRGERKKDPSTHATERIRLFSRILNKTY